MNAPDKVFFPNDINLLTKVSLVLKQEGDICYIRKDALLEWLENKTKEPPDSFVNGLIYIAYKEVIDKINSI